MIWKPARQICHGLLTRLTHTRANKAILLSLITITVIAGQLAWMLRSDLEMVRVRNSLIADVVSVADVDWTPASIPDAFLQETGEPPVEIRTVVREVLAGDTHAQGGLRSGLQLAAHLTASGPLWGGAIKSSTLTSYGKIVTEGRGYCADFSQVLNGLSIAGALAVREWGISVDGFGGEGHAFNEIFDPGLGKWVLIDAYLSFYAVDAGDGQPLSALEFRDRLQAKGGRDSVRIMPIDPGRYSAVLANQGPIIEIFRPGLDQMYLWYGNNVFSYDEHPAVRFFARFSRAAEGIAGIIAGVHPRIHIVATKTNQSLVSTLMRTKYRFMVSI